VFKPTRVHKIWKCRHVVPIVLRLWPVYYDPCIILDK